MARQGKVDNEAMGGACEVERKKEEGERRLEF
jgi:hypothetical protein